MNLHELIEKYGSDKNLSGYTNTYSSLFEDRRHDITSVLEIGLGTQDATVPSTFTGVKQHYPHYQPGNSLRVWRDYFPNAKIYGVDIAEDCMFSEDRISTFLFDSSNEKSCQMQLKNLTFDIIIDDGNHDPKYQMKTLKNLWSKLNIGGIYVIEDIGGYSGTEELFIEYKDEFEQFTKGQMVENRGNHVVIHKTPSNNITVVTGLWDIQRPGRSAEHYLEHFERILNCEQSMIVFVPKQFEEFVKERRDSKNTLIKVFELEDVKNIFSPFWEKTQAIRTNETWLNQTGEHGWLKNSPQATLEYYNPIVMSKMFLLHDSVCWNPFNTDYFIWLDAGITQTVYEKFFTENDFFTKLESYLYPFLFLSYPYDTTTEIHGFDIQGMNKMAGEPVKYVCRGGLFGGHKDIIREANSSYYSLLSNSLAQGYMGTEESIFTIMSYLQPEKYRRYSLDDNGLVTKFVQNVIANDVTLEDVPVRRKQLAPVNLDLSKVKLSLYMLTFNFPEQVRHTLETYKQHPEWLKSTRKILIDNSTNEEARWENKKICEEYGFEHIITYENLGINRGRFLAAKHFDESDSDYYIFLEDDMGLQPPKNNVCRNGLQTYVSDLLTKVQKIMKKENFHFLKLSFTEVFMDNYIQCSWYNVPQHVRTEIWPHYSQLPITGLDPDCPRTEFKKIDCFDGLLYASGEVYYANWPMIMSKEGNRKVFLETTWEHPFEQTWMSHIFQETRKGNIRPAVLLASPILHNRIAHYKPEERREN